MTDDQQQLGSLPEDVLLYPALCEALLDYTISLILGADDVTRQFIEHRLVSHQRRDVKIKMLRDLFKTRRPDLANQSPYQQLWSELKQLFEFRDKIAHSQPDHGDRFHRLRRYQGVNESLVVTPQEIQREIATGMRCHSALDAIPVYLYGFDRRPPGP